MAASLSLRVYTAAGPTESAARTGIDLISADNDTNSLANRQANPITVGTRSYEKWVRLKVDTAPANGVTNFKMWLGGDGMIQTSTTLYFTANYATYQQGTTASSTIANTTMTNFTSGNKATWDTASYSATNSITRAAIFQLEVGSDAQPGNWSQETVSYSYDET